MSTTTTTPPSRRTAIQIDARSEATLDSITAADFLEALGNDALPTLAHVWPEKKKLELHTEPEVSPGLKLGALLDRINEKRKVELATNVSLHGYPPSYGHWPPGYGMQFEAGHYGRVPNKGFLPYEPQENFGSRLLYKASLPKEYVLKQTPELPRDPSIVKGGGREPPQDLTDIAVSPADVSVLASQVAAYLLPQIEARMAGNVRAAVGR